MKVAASAAGKRVKCPKCATAITVPPPAPTEGPGEDDWGLGEEGGGLLDELAAVEKSSAALAQPNLQAVASPPGMSPPPPARASTGGGFSAGAAAASVAGGALLGVGRFFGPLALGSVLSAVGAAIGAALWVIVAMFAEREWGLIAWVLGILAGFGMWVGMRRESILGGLIASGLTFIAIIVAKYTIFVLVIVSILSAMSGKGPGGSSPLQRSAAEETRKQEVAWKRFQLTESMAESILDEWNVSTEIQRKEQRGTARSEALLRLKNVSDEEILRRWDEMEAAANAAENGGQDAAGGAASPPTAKPPRETMADQTVAPAVALSGEGDYADDEEYDEEYESEELTEEEAAHAVATAFGRMMFGFWDLLIIPFALITAFRIGYRGLVRE